MDEESCGSFLPHIVYTINSLEEQLSGWTMICALYEAHHPVVLHSFGAKLHPVMSRQGEATHHVMCGVSRDPDTDHRPAEGARVRGFFHSEDVGWGGLHIQ